MSLAENIKLVKYSYVNDRDLLVEGQRHVNTDIDVFYQIDVFLCNQGEYVTELLIDGIEDTSTPLTLDSTIILDEIVEEVPEENPLDEEDYCLDCSV